ncbi:hypothetical protein [Actinomadura macra]|uniref:hypothetical protein n=1 Tax=Actinomadura macra TaxID=46164 RepID=UPI000831994A|nr:hypothetical protein [Actinomadura macra]
MVPVDFAFNQVPNPATQIWKSGILANPDSKAIGVDSDQLFGIGMQTAIQQSPLRGKNVIVVGGEGGRLNYELIRQGTQTASVPLPYSWLMWGLADTLNRVFAGQNPRTLPSEGGGWQFVDKEHNLPASGAQYEPPVDFRSAYKKIWAGS